MQGNWTCEVKPVSRALYANLQGKWIRLILHCPVAPCGLGSIVE